MRALPIALALCLSACGSSSSGDTTDDASSTPDSASIDGATIDARPDVAGEVGDVGEVGRAPTITRFVATPPSITAGATSTLSWVVSDGAITVDGVAATGTSETVKPTATTTYTLKATNAFGSATATATVTVSASTVPTNPITYPTDTPFTVDSGTTNWVFVPSTYDSTHATPTMLFVWLHGCGGMSSGDIWNVSPGGAKQSWISLAVGGEEGGCWDMTADPPRVLAALADIKTHFNVKAKGVVLGGYSSGGDLTYRTGFYNAGLFAGLLVENSSPFRDTGSTESASLAAASWKINIVHLAHLQDTTYPIDGVRTETDAVTAAGFPMKRIEVDGGHYDDPGAIENGHAVPGTVADLQSILLPYLDVGWTAP